MTAINRQYALDIQPLCKSRNDAIHKINFAIGIFIQQVRSAI